MCPVSNLPAACCTKNFPPGPASSIRRKIEKFAECRLRESSYRALRSVRCEYHEGVLTLRGRLGSFYLKQIAQTLVAAIEEVELVCNRVEVETVAFD